MVLTDNGEQLIETLEANTGERATALEAIGVTHNEFRVSLPQKTMRRPSHDEAAAPVMRRDAADRITGTIGGNLSIAQAVEETADR